MSSAEAVGLGGLSLRSRVGAWLALARVSNTPTVVTDVLAGAAVATAGAALPAGAVALVAVACVLFYVAGMVLNDLLDLEHDRTARPERPLPSGAVSPRAAATAVAGLFAVGSGLLLAAGVAAFLLGLGLIGLIVLYDAWHKGVAFSPALMAGTRMMVYVVAFAAVAGAGAPADLLVPAALLGAYVAALTQVAKVEDGQVKLRPWAVALVLAPAVWAVTQGLVAAIAGAVLAAAALSGLHAVRQGRVGVGIGRLIAGIALVDAAVIASTGATGLAVAAALGGSLTLALQQKIAGT